jgi:hypothetical protein
MAPVYGLAENAVAVSLPPPGRALIIDRADREPVSGQGVAALARVGGRGEPRAAECKARAGDFKSFWRRSA